jgi:hypothetical protein
VGGAVLAIINVRKVEMARFRSVAGLPMLDIARAGKGSTEFDRFISALVDQIALCHPKSAQSHVNSLD